MNIAHSTHVPDFKFLFTLPLSLKRKGHGLLIYLPFCLFLNLTLYDRSTPLLYCSHSLQKFTIENNLSYGGRHILDGEYILDLLTFPSHLGFTFFLQ